jgi:hypothetical protein
MTERPGKVNREHAHRHAWNALADFSALRKTFHGEDRDLAHSISHHLRHIVYRTGLEVSRFQRHYARRHQR